MASTYKVLVTGELVAKTSTNTLKALPNASFTLVRKASTSTPAIIYTDENGTIGNSSGTVTTDARGAYSVYLDPDQAPFVEKYNDVLYNNVAVYPSKKESESDLEAFAAAKGFNGVSGTEQIATRTWVASQGFAAGLSTEDVQDLIDTSITAALTTAFGSAKLPIRTGTTGPPGSGAHLQGEIAVDNTGRIWTCSIAGTPGTWRTEPRLSFLDADDADPTNPQQLDIKVQLN